MNTYLGTKGYTILKKELSAEQQSVLKKELTAVPFTQGQGQGQQEQITYPVYRESANKFYIPRYYGEKTFGKIKECKITEGNAIDVPFAGTLRENQVPVVETFMKQLANGGSGGLLELPCAFGKCCGINTPIMMYDGTIKMVQDVIVGDILMGDDSTPRNVLSLARGRETMYKVYSMIEKEEGEEAEGEEAEAEAEGEEAEEDEGYVVNESHILSLKCASDYSKNMKKGQVIDMSVLDYLNLPKCFHEHDGVLHGYRVPIHFSEKTLPIDPYMIGYWLGDASSSKNPTISCQDSTVLDYFADNLKKHNLALMYISQFDYDICGNDTLNGNIFMNTLNELNLVQNKHIPSIYKTNSRENRLKLLAGLIDSNGGFEFTQQSNQMMDDIIYLCRSLGFASHKHIRKTSCTNKGIKHCDSAFRITITEKGIDEKGITEKGIDEIPTLIPRKKSSTNRQIKDALNYRIYLKKLDVDDYYGFQIDGNKRFVLGDFTVTHNTTISLNLCSQIKRKTIIIVHKEFLMNQWIERIQQFLPSARVGKIQAKIIDIENKDIVIGMLQSLSMKDYPDNMFESFGLTIIDEVHHISSEVFSCALFKIVTKYTLGLSATMERKDGTTKIFKMFLGDVVYKGTRDENHAVVVRGIEYVCNDDEFNEIKYNFRGEVMHSTMISKLCAYNHRSEFILKILVDMLKENDKQQIMILAHNRCLLKYFHDAIEHRDIASCGYYVGGMKQEALKLTESKQIVIATYSMAAEALDIKTLTTLIMTTPKTDIQQSVGRILRERHSKPIVVDIIDKHQNFKNQWTKRKAFYRKEDYKIIYTTSTDYTTDISKWKVVSYSKSSCDDADADTDANADSRLTGKCLIKLLKK